VRRVLRQIDLVAAQNVETAERFRQLGANPAAVVATGSLKFDGAQTDRQNPKTRELRELAGLAEEAVVLLAGSTQEPEEAYALDIFRRLSPEHPLLRLVLVPRHPQRFDEVAHLLDDTGLAWQRRSSLVPATRSVAAIEQDRAESSKQDRAESSCNSRDSTSRRILLVDSIGELGAWWGTATIGFVGGSFGSRGGQNMLEPAAYGVATCFGPNTWNFRDIVAQLLAAEGAVVVRDSDELEQFISRGLGDPAWARRLGQRARQLVLAQQGATARTVDLLTPLVTGDAAEASRSAA